MIKYIKGNLFDSKCQVLVNTVNLLGVMGKGIALEFKNRYPSMYEEYRVLCKKKLFGMGQLWIYKNTSDRKWILNFPTKINWRFPSTYQFIILGLQKFRDTYKDKGITSIAFPKLGCNNGGLDWSKVKPLMEEYLDDLDLDIEIYE